MNKLIILLLIVAGNANANERILDFHSRISVLDNGDIHVIESIQVNVENNKIRHGIFRDTPTLYYGVFFSHQKFDVTIISILLDDKAVDYHQERLLNGIRIKIGSKDYYVDKGIHKYQIEYISNQQVKDLEQNNGLYWNVTGNDWNFLIEHASVDIYFPRYDKINISTQDAWTGIQGSTRQDFTSQIFDDHIHFETSKKLNRQEGFTIQITWPMGLITHPKNKTWIFIKNNVFWMLSILMLFLYPWYFYNTWKKVGIDPPKKPIYPLFKPPNDISPAALRFVREKYHDSKGLSIAIMSLAVKGHITIEQISKKKYILTRLDKQVQTDMSKGEKTIFKYLFDNQKTLTIDSEYNSRIETASDILEKTLVNEHQDAFYKDNLKVWALGVFISLLVILFTWIHFFNLSSIAWPYLKTPIIGILVLAGVLHYIPKPAHKLLSITFSTGILFLGMITLLDKVYGAYLVLIIIITIINTLFYYLIQAPTVFGQKLLGKIEGFRMYLNTAEQDRLDLMHPPEMTPKLFEKYLPYALALGVENRWSEQFDKAMKLQHKDPNNYQPSWYLGNSYSSFNFASTATAIGAGLASSVVAASTPPSSNSSGGFGGGGFSGGGGGGGGGGGW